MRFVILGGCGSELLPVVSGVPQGSYLGLLLFLVQLSQLSGINLTDEPRQTAQLSNSGSARNVIKMSGMDVASMAIGSLDTVTSEILNSLDN